MKEETLGLSKYTIGIDPYDKKQSALEWLVTELFAYRQPNSIEIQLVKHAKEMEKQRKGYSEEEVLKLLKKFYQDNNFNGTITEWFEQFKKK
jgi:hypothetical protein